MNYIGGKYKILDSIIPTFPDKIHSFVDLFAGGMNVGINVKADTIYINDRVNYVIDIYKYFRDTDVDDLIQQIERRISEFGLSSDNKESYINFRNSYNRTRETLDLFILTCFSFNHNIRFNNSHEFNATFGMRSWNDSIKSNLIQFCKALHEKSIIFSSNDFRDFDYSVLSSGDLVYCDPPYLISVASYSDGNRGFGGWKDEDDIALYTLLDELNSKDVLFALSNVTEHHGKQNDHLIEWSKKYHTTFIDKQYTDCSYNVKDRYSKTVEVLITNFEPRVKSVSGSQRKLF